jgi:glycosyltransferase involved in cell wall biosynthesis
VDYRVTMVRDEAEVTWVIPCYNEAVRLDHAAFVSLVRRAPRTHLLFVNDGSTDKTSLVLEQLTSHAPDRIGTLVLARNVGKAEAVRRGLQHALDAGGQIVGYADADLATPIDELDRLLDVLVASGASALLASRVALLGRHIERRATRHYLGRVFSTAASLALALPVYDTQCGAKLFRRCDALTSALATPFLSRWVFDVELIGRLLTGPKAIPRAAIIEEPLKTWRDIAGSSLGWIGMSRAALDLARIAIALRR